MDLNTIENREIFLQSILDGSIIVEDTTLRSQGDLFDSPCDIEELITTLGGKVVTIGEGAMGHVREICLDQDCIFSFVLKEIYYDRDR